MSKGSLTMSDSYEEFAWHVAMDECVVIWVDIDAQV